MASNFYWGDIDGWPKMHWISWERLCLSKENGGLGFRDSSLHNSALLSKMAWRLWSDPNSLLFHFLKAIYFPHNDFLDATCGHRPSWGWRSLMEGNRVLAEGLCWRIGTGLNVDIWQDAWVPTLADFKVTTPYTPLIWPSKVSNLIDESNRTWSDDVLSSYFNDADIVAIKKINLSLFPQPDKLEWMGSRNGVFSIRSTYHLLSNKEQARTSFISNVCLKVK
ncbi:uncharacterized mitochondrial protein AtMg00310-like [Telopea speciosissima]|uniref:uncharacterized mitochondrial protein AtMg00310-like n=1 Tax=Telopea speciosissima TaxID=54955 RepID=UPI001CC412D0|nr:uncharacterized mitochondrial protein AtMg00310-like [Telopea speciosissima]